MRKSSSLQVFPVGFNPNEFKVGQSKIDNLPLRRHSASQLPSMDALQYKEQIKKLKHLNDNLFKENERLKRQVECYRQQASTKKTVRTDEKTRDYLGIIKDKMSSQARQSRNTQCDTGLYSSKQVSSEPSSLNISDYYEQFNLTHKVPSISDLQDIAARFFKNYCDSYAKLVTLFKYLQYPESNQPYRQLKDLIELYKMPLLYQQSPQTLLRQVSKSKERLKTAKSIRQSQSKMKGAKKEKEQICWEALSPEQTVSWTEELLKKVIRSTSMLRMLSKKETILRFVQKVQDQL